MAEHKGTDIIIGLKQKWVSFQLLADVVLAIAFGLFAAAILHLLLISVWWSVGVFIIACAILLYIHRPWEVSLFSVSDFLNQAYPELEESAELVIKSPAELTLLQRFQLLKVEQALSVVPALPKQFTHNLRRSAVFAIGGIIVLLAFSFIKRNPFAASDAVFGNQQSQKTTPPEKILPQISAI